VDNVKQKAAKPCVSAAGKAARARRFSTVDPQLMASKDKRESGIQIRCDAAGSSGSACRFGDECSGKVTTEMRCEHRPDGSAGIGQRDADAPYPMRPRSFGLRIDEGAKRVIDVFVSAWLLLIVSPLVLLVAIAIRVDSPGPVLYRGRRVGFHGSVLWILKFRKMHEAATGPALTLSADSRLTRVGRFLALSKLDELPQLWNVLRGDMSLVGPRPEHHSFVAFHPDAYERITQVRPGITGLSQLAFAEESRILDPDDRLGHYVDRLLPQKTHMDQLYAARRTLLMDFRILFWTAAAVLLRRDVAVHRRTGRLNLRRRPKQSAQVPTPPPLPSEHSNIVTPVDAGGQLSR
jgi:lipopolysaccharide/colanic/teichoic acid biosynthesis glycosyltransferase